MTPDFLLYIYQLISKNTLDNKDDEGAFRKSNDVYVINHIESEVRHRPPDFNEIPEPINQACEFFNNNDDKFFIHPVIKGISVKEEENRLYVLNQTARTNSFPTF